MPRDGEIYVLGVCASRKDEMHIKKRERLVHISANKKMHAWKRAHTAHTAHTAAHPF